MADTSKYKDKINPPFQNGEWVVATHSVTSNLMTYLKHLKWLNTN
jgi:hypothetical protein